MIERRKKQIMVLMIEEQETHINFCRNDERAEIYTSDTTKFSKLFKLSELSGTEWKLERVHKLKNGEIIGYTFSFPVKCISFRKKSVTRNYTEEQRKAIGERLKASRESADDGQGEKQ